MTAFPAIAMSQLYMAHVLYRSFTISPAPFYEILRYVSYQYMYMINAWH